MLQKYMWEMARSYHIAESGYLYRHIEFSGHTKLVSGAVVFF